MKCLRTLDVSIVRDDHSRVSICQEVAMYGPGQTRCEYDALRCHKRVRLGIINNNIPSLSKKYPVIGMEARVLEIDLDVGMLFP